MKETAEGFVAMIDGYNQAIDGFNESAAAICDMEAELERIEAESPEEWVRRFREKYGRWPNPSYFRYKPLTETYISAPDGKPDAKQRASRSPRRQGTGYLQS